MSRDSIEDIIIEIESDSTEAVSQLDLLTERLQALKKATAGSATVANFAKNFETLNRSLSWMNSIDPAKVEAIRNFASGASTLKGLTISKSLGEQLEKINNAMISFSPEGISKMSELANAMFLLKEMEGFRYPTGLNSGLLKTAQLAEQLKDADFTKMKELIDAITQLGQLSTADSGAVKDLANSMKVLSTETKQATARGRTFNTVLANIRTKTLGFYAALRWVSRGMTKSLSVYGDYVEALNLYKMAIGEAAGEEYEFAKRAQDLLGIDLTQWMQAQGVFNALASGFGVASDKAALMSRNLTQLAYDISSFYNISVEDAIQKVQSGFAGQIRPVRNLGYDLSQARLEAIALANGIDEEVKSMTQAEKSQLRYIALMTQLTEVHGDLSRTLDSPTNQLRLLNAQLDQMQRSIGLVLLPILNKAIPYLNAMLRVIRMISEEIAAMFGYTLPALSASDFTSNISMGADELEEGFDDATASAEKLKNTLASFDQINLITSASGGNGKGNDLSSAIDSLDLDLPTYDFLGDVTENQAQKLAEGMMKSIRPIVDIIKAIILFTVDNIETITSMLEAIAAVTIGKNMMNSIAGVFSLDKKEMQAFKKFVDGLALTTLGLQISYIGGKNMGKGNMFEGLLESTVGVAAAAIGGYMMLGPLGMAITIPLSLVAVYSGWNQGNREKMREEADAIFFAFREGRQDVEEFQKSWENFLDKFGAEELQNRYTIADKLEEDVKEIGFGMLELHNQYIMGNVTSIAYAQNLESMYASFEESVSKHIEGVSQAIRESLDGPLGIWLQSQGKNIEQLKNDMDQSYKNIIEDVARIGQEIEKYNKQLENGEISQQKHQELIDGMFQEMNKYYDFINLNSEATKGFFEAFNPENINFSDMNQVIDLIKEMGTAYETTAQQIETAREKDVQAFELAMLDPNLTEEKRKEYEEAIRLTNVYYDEQQKALAEGYKDYLQVIENTGFVDWMEVYDVEGIDHATEKYLDGMDSFNQALEEAYGKSKLITRDKTPFTILADTIDAYADDYNKYEKSKTNLFDIVGAMTWGHDAAMDWESMLKQERRFIDDQFSYVNDLRKKGVFEEKKASQSIADLSYSTTEKQKYYVSTYGQVYSGIWANLPNEVMKSTAQSLVNMSPEEFQKRANMIKTSIGDEFGDKSGYIKNNIKNAMDIASGSIVAQDLKNKYKSNSDSLLNVMVDTLKDPMNKVDNAIKDALSTSSSETVDIGKGIGLGIAKGIESTTGETESSVSKLTKRMGKPFNQFGSDLYDYMNAMTVGIVAIWNSIEISTGKASLSSKLKIPKWAMKGYASGGFPNSADFFYANENGVPEYIGSMGGRAAVANNQEITKGVADAVYKAIKETGIAGDVKKIANKKGNVVFAPSEEAGRVMQQSVNMYNQTGGRY